MIDVDIRYLPGQDHQEIRAAVEALPDVRRREGLPPPAGDRAPRRPYVQALGEAISRVAEPTSERLGVGRDGASDAISFLEAGVPAVECGPSGDGHHGPEEWVSIRSLGQYRAALVEFVNLLPARWRPAVKTPPPPDRLTFEDTRPRWKRLLIGAFLCHLRGRRRHRGGGVSRGRQDRQRAGAGPRLKLGKDTLATTDPGSRRRS